MPNQSDIDNRANQLNPNNDAYYQSRGYDDKEDYDNQNSYDDYNDEWDDDDDYFAQPDEDEWDPYEENYEYEDMPGDNADEREEYYDNIDWNARDQIIKFNRKQKVTVDH